KPIRRPEPDRDMASEPQVDRANDAGRLNLALARLRTAGARSLGNSRQTIAIVRRRSGRHARHARALAWGMPLLLVATLTLVAFLVLDEPAGAYRGQWGATVGLWAVRMTDIGLGVWYVVPAVLALIVVNQVDWARFKGQRLLILYNW